MPIFARPTKTNKPRTGFILGRESAIQKAKTIRLFSVKIAIVNCQRSAQPPSANAVYLVYRGAIMQKR